MTLCLGVKHIQVNKINTYGILPLISLVLAVVTLLIEMKFTYGHFAFQLRSSYFACCSPFLRLNLTAMN